MYGSWLRMVYQHMNETVSGLKKNQNKNKEGIGDIHKWSQGSFSQVVHN